MLPHGRGAECTLAQQSRTHLPGLPSWAIDFATEQDSRERDGCLCRTAMSIEPKLEFRQIGGREAPLVGSSFDRVAMLGPKLYDVEQDTKRDNRIY